MAIIQKIQSKIETIIPVATIAALFFMQIQTNAALAAATEKAAVTQQELHLMADKVDMMQAQLTSAVTNFKEYQALFESQKALIAQQKTEIEKLKAAVGACSK